MKNKILSFVLAVAILIQFSACSKNNEKEESITTTEFQMLDLPELKGITIDISTFINEIDSIEVEYKNPEYYEKINYDRLISAANNVQGCDFNENYSWEDIYSIILENSRLIEIQDGQSEARANIATALHMALENLFSENNDIGDDFCKLKDTKIFLGTIGEEGVLASYINKENTIIVDYNKILNVYNSLADKDEITFLQYLCNNLRHELNHVRQNICNCRKEKGQEFEAIRSKDDELSLMVEASAESEIYYKEINELLTQNTHTMNFTYPTERKTQSLMLLMGMFKEDFTLEKYYEAIFDSDFNELYDLFDLEKKEEFITFYNIMYARNSFERKTSLSEELKNDELNYEEINESIGNEYKIDIFKIVVKDLINKINNEKLPLEESLKLYNLIKAVVINEEINYEKTYLLDNYEDFKHINSIFYSFICKHYNIELNDVQELESEEFVNYMDDLFDYFTSSTKNENVENFIKKYPIIAEIIFCNNLWMGDVKSFDKAEKRLILN